MSVHFAVARFMAFPAFVLSIGVAAGCSSSSKGSSNPTTTTGDDGGTTTTSGHPANVVNMAANDWLSAELNDEVAGILLQEQLGITVNHVKATTAGQWASIRQGALDVSLEVWPSGHPDEMSKLNSGDPTVENGGLLGPTAKVGWIIPTYLLTQHPELATWEGYKDPNNVALFQSASSGSKGRFVGGDPSWVQYDQKILNNLGLNFEVEMAGSEAAELAELDTAYTKRQAILFYLWIPHWAWAKYDLTMVTLPTNTDACWSQATSTTGPACDYPTDHLFKLLRPALKTDSPVAYQFLKNMSYTTKDQITMMAAVTENGMTVEAAARDWLSKNTSTWKAWLPAQ